MSTVLEQIELADEAKATFMKRFPWAPLDRALSAHLASEGIGLKTFCDRNDLSLRRLQRARSQGAISWLLGDKVACAMGLHPAVVWWALW